MNELLLNGIVVTTNIKSHTDYKELFPIEIYSHPPTRKKRRKRERELKKK